MSDPWADVRTDPDHGNTWLHEHTDDADGFVGDTIVVAEEDVEALLERILTDADALLAVVRELPAFVPGVGLGRLTSSLDAAYAALPEHLKSDNSKRELK